MMLCPNCKTAEELRITATTVCTLYVNREGDVIDEGEFYGWEWDDESFAFCQGCDWEGTVQDMIDADPEAQDVEILPAEPEQLANGQYGYPSIENPIA